MPYYIDDDHLSIYGADLVTKQMVKAIEQKWGSGAWREIQHDAL